MSERLYLVDGDGLIAMRSSAPPAEDRLQLLIARHAELIAGEDEDLLLIRREQGVPGDEGGARWSLDHLFVTREALPVLVEVKRAVDTRLRREVVGQLLDYAANGAVYWSAATLAQSFGATCAGLGTTPEDALGDFVGAEESTDRFWERVEANLRDGQMRIVVAADRIPPELARIIEFLNEQMRAEVLAIELRYFEAMDGRLTLAPRVIGQTERLRTRKSTPMLEAITIDDWLDREVAPTGSETRAAAELCLQVLTELGAETAVTKAQGSIFSRVLGMDRKESYPIYVMPGGSCAIAFVYNNRRGRLADEIVRKEFLERFTAAVGPLSTANLNGWPAFPVVRLTDPARASAFREVARDWVETCRNPRRVPVDSGTDA